MLKESTSEYHINSKYTNSIHYLEAESHGLHSFINKKNKLPTSNSSTLVDKLKLNLPKCGHTMQCMQVWTQVKITKSHNGLLDNGIIIVERMYTKL